MTDALTQDVLRDHLRYDPVTGVFTRATAYKTSHAKVGDVAGKTDGHGHRQIRVMRKAYAAHRLAFLWMTGSWPTQHVDHINGDRSDNRWINLRDVSRQVNNQNIRTARQGSASGLLGVTQSSGRFVARIKVRGKERYLGVFGTAIEAHEAYVLAKRIQHEGCTI